MSSPEADRPLRFGAYLLEPANARLTRGGEAIELAPKAFELLAYLVRRPNELLTKDTLLDEVWGRRFVSEGVIKTAISELRTALGDDARAPRWIETVQRRGYRFIGTPQAAPAAAGPAPPPTAAKGNLPGTLPPTLARGDELAALTALLQTQRLLTIAGPAGIGKTRLALALAAQQRAHHADGAWLVELAPLAAEATDAATLRATLVQALQLSPAATASDAALAAALQSLDLLLLLDNAEHLLEVLAPMVATLWAQVPALRIVLTSQEPLRVPGEQVFRLSPLAVPLPGQDEDAAQLMGHGAVQLFVDRVAARLPGFALTPHQQQAVAQICRALDGLPLALELAAARVPLLGVHGLAERLVDDDDESNAHLQLLTQGPRTAAPRQRTLRDALQWSHELLSDAHQRVFRRLAVFRGGFSLAMAQRVCADDTLDEWAVLDALDALVEKSLLVAPAGTDTAPRFGQLESVRAFALERLAQAGELEATRRLHVLSLRDYWARADLRALSDASLPWVERHAPDVDNLRAALRWASAQPALADEAAALLGHSVLLWTRLGLAMEGKAWCEAVRPAARASQDIAVRAIFDLGFATLALYTNTYTPAEGHAAARRAAEAFARTQDTQDTVRRYFALYLTYFLALRLDTQGNHDSLLAEMEAMVRPGWGELLTRHGRFALANELRRRGPPEAYLKMCHDEVARYRRLGALSETWMATQGVMLAELDAGRPALALAIGREALDEIRSRGRFPQHTVMLAVWTTVLAESGDTAGTRQVLAEALPILRGAGTPWMAHAALAWLAAHEGRDADAARMLGWHEAVLRSRGESGDGYVRRTSRALLAQLHTRLGAAEAAALQREGEALGEDAAQGLALQEAA